MTLSYDADADVLYLAFEDPAPGGHAMYVETEGGDVLRIDPTTLHVLGCTVPFFLKRASHEEVSIPVQITGNYIEQGT